jgi:hypothetical protein
MPYRLCRWLGALAILAALLDPQAALAARQRVARVVRQPGEPVARAVKRAIRRAKRDGQVDLVDRELGTVVSVNRGSRLDPLAIAERLGHGQKGPTLRGLLPSEVYLRNHLIGSELEESEKETVARNLVIHAQRNRNRWAPFTW